MNLNKLRAKIVERGETQRTIAIKMNKSKNTINAILMGYKKPRVDEVKELCEILEIRDSKEKCDIFLT